jgi:hypothetical protein
MARLLWLSTVLGANFKIAAASGTVQPKLTSRTTSTSRFVSSIGIVEFPKGGIRHWRI